MKPLLTKAEKLANEQSKNRQRVIALNRKGDTADGLDEAERAELNTAIDRLENIEVEIRAARVSEAAERLELEAEAAKDGGGNVDPEQRERADLARRVKVGSYLRAFMSGSLVAGAESELRAATACADNAFPTLCLDVPYHEAVRSRAENRAVTGLPTSGTGANLARLAPFVFAESIATRLLTEFRSIGSGSYSIPRITTAPSTAAPVGKGVAADATAGQIEAVTGSPKRVPARLTVALEDIAAFGSDEFESGLRDALQGQLSHSLDNQVVNGDGQGANINGFIAQLDDPAVPSAGIETFDRWIAGTAALVDGLWARDLMALFQVWGEEAFGQAAAVFRGADSPVSAASYLNREAGGFIANARMPAASAHVATGLCVRTGMRGLSKSVVGDYGTIVVDDHYSNAAEGQRHFTVSALVTNLLIVQPASYSQLSARISV